MKKDRVYKLEDLTNYIDEQLAEKLKDYEVKGSPVAATFMEADVGTNTVKYVSPAALKRVLHNYVKKVNG